MSEASTPAPSTKIEEVMENRPESPPLGLLDPARIQNPLADQPPPQMPETFVIPEPRPQPWQRSTPVMSPATSGYPAMGGAPGTPGSQRSSTGTPQFMHHETSPQQQHYEQHYHQQYQQQPYHLQQQQVQQQQQVYYAPQPPPGYPGGGYPGAVPPGARAWPPAPHPQARGALASPAAQRVVVPYPQGQMTPGGTVGVVPQPQPQPGYPLTSPVTRTPPRPYPQGVVAASLPPPQQPPPQQQQPQYPPSGGPYHSPAPQMYRTVGGAVVAQVAPMQQRAIGPPQQVPQQQQPQAQVGQAPPQYMSPQTPVTPHSHFGPSVQQQQQMTPSPHFVGPDLRSPTHLMSPSQPVVTPNIRPMPLPVPPVPYRTHDMRQIANVNTNPELFLTGSVFHVFDAERLISDKLDVMNLVFAIKFHGGDIDFGHKTYPERQCNVTHVIIDSNRSPYARPLWTSHLQPMEQRKRLVTLQWLMDVLQKQKMEVPWKLAHLPGPFTDQFRPYTGKLFSVAGFDETERPAIQFMTEAMGARISPFLAKFNDLLIAKSTMSAMPKIERARQWNVPVVTFQWLAEAYCTASQVPHERPTPENPRYHIGQPSVEVNSTPNMMELLSPEFKTLLLAWKQAVIVTDALIARAQESRLRLMEDDAHFPNNRFLSREPAPSDEQIAEAEKRRRDVAAAAAAENDDDDDESRVRIIVAFGNGFTEPVLETLKKKLIFLGGQICDDVKDCTHLVLLNGRRSRKLLEGICLGKNIMSCDWILDGYKNGAIMDTLDYFLRDEDIERQLGYSCKRSVLRSRHRQIFEGVQFYITKSVLPDYDTVKSLIELAGGRVVADKPTAAQIAKCIEADAAFLVISCDVDVRSMSYLAECNFPIYNVDLVFTSILRQNIELHPVFRVLVMVRHNRVVAPPQPPQPQRQLPIAM